MLKFKDQNGEVKFILRDEDSAPLEVHKISKQILAEMGIIVEEEDTEEDIRKKIKIKLGGLSQDDSRMLGR